MKTFKILICALSIFSHLHAQTTDTTKVKTTETKTAETKTTTSTRSVFRRGYMRFGLSSLGSSLDNNLSPKENVFKGNYGAGQGYALEFGHVFYFKSKSKDKFNYGLDWTIFSATCNKLDGWDSYAGASKGEAFIDGSEISASISSKLGPVVSFNPVEKLVIDARFQIAAIGRFTPFEYYENEDEPSFRSFAFYNYGQEDIDDNFDAESIQNTIAFGIGTNFGITVRRKAIGLSFDYTSVNPDTNYDAYEGEDNHSFGKYKIPTHTFQLKLSITL